MRFPVPSKTGCTTSRTSSASPCSSSGDVSVELPARIRSEPSYDLMRRMSLTMSGPKPSNGPHARLSGRDRLEACRCNQPGARLFRNARLRPGLQSGGERLMHGLFGEIQISEEAHERRQNPARFRSVKSLNGLADLFGHRRRHLRQTSKRSGSTQLRSGFPYPQFSGPPLR